MLPLQERNPAAVLNALLALELAVGPVPSKTGIF
jgi:hypothetical protein